MKTYSKEQRIVNIFSKAVELGFTFENNESFEENLLLAETFLIEKADAMEYYCPVTNHRSSQHASYADRMGYEWWADGEICSYDKFNAPEHKYFHSTIVNSLGEVVKLYDLQGENEFNTPVTE